MIPRDVSLSDSCTSDSSSFYNLRDCATTLYDHKSKLRYISNMSEISNQTIETVDSEIKQEIVN